MVLSLLLVAVLAQGDQSPVATPPTVAAAVQLATAGRDAEALQMFQRVAADNPGDREARLWIARLHERMGHPVLAEAVYRSILLEDGANLGATLGLGTTLLTEHRATLALEVLERAEGLGPQNADVQFAIGRAHALAGHDARSVEHFQRALDIAPSPRRRAALTRARDAYAHRVDATFLGERFSGAGPDSRGGDVGANLRVADRLRVSGRAQVVRKFGSTDERGGGGVEWRWTPSTVVVGQALAGTSNTVLPQGDYLGGVEYRRDAAMLTARVRYFDFQGAHMTVVSPAITWRVDDRLTVGLQYARTVTDLNTSSSITGHTALVRGSYVPLPRLHVVLGYARGIDDFDTLSIDRIGAFRGRTGSAGLQVDLPSRTSLVAGYDLQKRHGGGGMTRFTVSLAQRF